MMEGAHAVAAVCNAGSSGSDGVLDLIKAGAAVTAGNADMMRCGRFNERIILIKLNGAGHRHDMPAG